MCGDMVDTIIGITSFTGVVMPWKEVSVMSQRREFVMLGSFATGALVRIAPFVHVLGLPQNHLTAESE